ncbi:MAG TPA: nitrogenase component 1 [Anaeromyxobacteraceae bacterium]|nr:nitrogenase component 1 [Anaeromyxobacteraceae bacterium]
MAALDDRNGCALHGALALLDAVEGIVPILHASAGCGVAGNVATAALAGLSASPLAAGGETSSTVLHEKQVVFGGTSRLREQIKNTVKVHAGDLYVVASGCVPEVVGDDVPAMVKEAREQRFPVLSLAAPGFKGSAWSGYALAARALLDQLPALLPPTAAGPAPDVNLFGIVPGRDPGWDGDLLEIEALLAEAGVRANRLLGWGQGVEAWREAPRARASVVLSPWGAPAAALLAERHGTPIVDLGFVPVGSRDAGLLVERVAAALALPQGTLDAARARLDGRLRHFLGKAAATLLLADVQKRTAVVGPSATAVGQARFLAGTLGQLVERVVITDEPAADRRAALAAAVREEAGAGVEVLFQACRGEIEALLRRSGPELVLGSALERAGAQGGGAALVEGAGPVRRSPILRRSLAGVDGAIRLVEEIIASLRALPVVEPPVERAGHEAPSLHPCNPVQATQNRGG